MASARPGRGLSPAGVSPASRPAPCRSGRGCAGAGGVTAANPPACGERGLVERAGIRVRAAICCVKSDRIRLVRWTRSGNLRSRPHWHRKFASIPLTARFASRGTARFASFGIETRGEPVALGGERRPALEVAAWEKTNEKGCYGRELSCCERRVSGLGTGQGVCGPPSRLHRRHFFRRQVLRSGRARRSRLHQCQRRRRRHADRHGNRRLCLQNPGRHRQLQAVEGQGYGRLAGLGHRRYRGAHRFRRR